MDYGKVYSRFWRSKTVRRWDDNARMLALYLLTSHHATSEGYYHLPIAYMAADLNWSIDTVEAAMKQLDADDFARYDADAEVVLVVKALRWNTPVAPTQIKGAISRVVEVPTSHLLEEFATPSEAYPDDLNAALRTLHPTHSTTDTPARPSEGPKETVSIPPPDPVVPSNSSSSSNSTSSSSSSSTAGNRGDDDDDDQAHAKPPNPQAVRGPVNANADPPGGSWTATTWTLHALEHPPPNADIASHRVAVLAEHLLEHRGIHADPDQRAEIHDLVLRYQPAELVRAIDSACRRRKVRDPIAYAAKSLEQRDKETAS